MNIENPENVRCPSCKCFRAEASFYNQKGRRLKTCQNCRDFDKKAREKQKCSHGRQKTRCKDCGGNSICSHNRRKECCKDCEGASQVCEHSKRRDQCRECNGNSFCIHGVFKPHCISCKGSYRCNHKKIRSQCKICSDPIKVTIKNMLSGAKQNDKKYNMYDAVNFVDKCFIENLLEDYTHCYYEDCKKELQILEYNDSLASLERINNNLGHIKSNCVICCLLCNRIRKSKATTE